MKLRFQPIRKKYILLLQAVCITASVSITMSGCTADYSDFSAENVSQLGESIKDYLAAVPYSLNSLSLPASQNAETEAQEVQTDIETSASDAPVQEPDKLVIPDNSVLELLRHAMEPVGSTLYIWGGAWNEEDTGGGIESVTLGVSEAWAEFYNSQDASYNYSWYDYQIHDGLDCSGFVGWVLYNTFEDENNQESYVTWAKDQTAMLAQNGWGTITPSWEVADYKPGDIMSAEDHIFIVLQSFEDGSVLLVHASPPGVQIAGTPDADGYADSMAAMCAAGLMEEHFADYYARYPDSIYVDGSYLYRFDQFRWNEETMPDAGTISKIKPEELFAHLF